MNPVTTENAGKRHNSQGGAIPSYCNLIPCIALLHCQQKSGGQM